MKRGILLLAALTTLSLSSLTACIPSPARQIVKTEYIRQQVPSPPAAPGYYPVEFTEQGGMYCLDLGNAKNLLKNRELDRGYQDEMKEILDQLKGQN